MIKSFEYKTVKNILVNVSEDITTQELIQIIKREQLNHKVYKDLNLDTLKIYFKKFGNKSQNLVINIQGEDLEAGKSLKDQGIEDETELSFFNQQAFEQYKLNPELKW